MRGSCFGGETRRRFERILEKMNRDKELTWMYVGGQC
jgi:hypothetical protein